MKQRLYKYYIHVCKIKYVNTNIVLHICIIYMRTSNNWDLKLTSVIPQHIIIKDQINGFQSNL